MTESSAVYRRRRIAAIVGAAVAAALIVFAITQLTGSNAAEPSKGGAPRAEATPKPKPAAELPRGGRTILPDFRVVAYYGAPQDKQLGALGIGSPTQMTKKLERQAQPYARKTRPILPAMELIAVVAAAHPGDGDRYNLRQPDSVIRRYLKAARKAKALLILDIQPGRSDFFTETKRLRKWLKEPDVGLALDPEWRMAPGQIPGEVIGSVSAREVNATSAWLDQLVTHYNLPQKLLLVHEFTDDMVPEAQLKPRKGLAYVMNVDGFGGQALKIAKYKGFAGQDQQFRRGFKLFYQEDQGMMSPAQVMRLQPRPDVVVYE
ncbi:hypothetical protein OM076_39285 [Solirubrobacter ginsenosidimutans]|uniref:Lipoprotein n=1 Tax=Solirubrobacter ginsenosidimutans TaxID=490573 RepID=A0A9X3N0V6_9ACTN|nr:hypothetical protein [Solirubrobacter ginsenosidimutans]MDA0166374.1 hypothetical protein [Solirubrobacter ginsenosidimutans]